MNTIALMIRFWLCSVMLFAFSNSEAAQVDVRVFDRDGRAVEGIVVALHPTQPGKAATAGQEPECCERRSAGAAAISAKQKTATMDQVDQRFVPYVVPVHAGTAVLFPNSDSVAHQVYSFSPAKRFELGLYRGRAHAPVVFDKTGVVVIGCNIHDKMIGYVYVTEAEVFGKTNEVGQWQGKDIPAGEYRIELWSPLFARDEAKLSQVVRIDDATPAQTIFNLTHAMRSAPRAQTVPMLRDY